jgi:hypothetical protein
MRSGSALAKALLLALAAAAGCSIRSPSEGQAGRGASAGQTYPVVLTAPPIGGIVTSSIGGIDCGAASVGVDNSVDPPQYRYTWYGSAPGLSNRCGQADVPWSQPVVLTATPQGGYAFLGWAGDCAGLAPACQLSAGAGKSVVALFGTAGSGHTNLADPALHAPAYADFLAGAASALQCPACHGAALQGQGIAPSCSACHAAPLTPVSAPAPIVASGPDATFTPAAIGFDAAELVNPLRGQYSWYNLPGTPAGWPVVDAYRRFNWDELESSAGVYHFEAIDAELADARARGGRFGLRVMALCQGCAGHTYLGAGSSIPDDLAAAMSPLVAAVPGEARPYLIPDWNAPAYLDRLDALVQALAARYRDDPHFAFVDVFSYGNWGEWHLTPFDEPGGPYDTSAQRPITDQNARLLVRRAAAAFGNKLLVINVANHAALAEAVASTSPPIGLRVDCLGSDGLAGGELLSQVPGAAERWRSAPFVTEWCPYNRGGSGADLFVQGEQQVRQYHVSMLSSDNFVAPPTSAVERAAFRTANVEAGYRLRAASVEVHLQSDSVRVRSRWINDGVAPTYLAWRAVLTLGGGVEVPLVLDLRQVMPQTPLDDDETVALGIALPSGLHPVGLRVEDLQGVSQPMQLAMQARGAEGGYLLGSVTLP